MRKAEKKEVGKLRRWKRKKLRSYEGNEFGIRNWECGKKE
jgi:hypothetical protein